MDTALHFISGLPRAGSTLLAALLNQNPRFRAGMTGPVAGLIEAMLKAMSMASDTSVFVDDRQRAAALHGAFAAFHGDLPAGHVSFDTDRGWCARMPLIATLFPAARVIACVRDVAEIMDSIERLAAANPLQPSGLFDFEPGGTVYSRVEVIGRGNGMVGASYNGLREAWYGPHADRLLVITYDTLASEPDRALAAVYDFIGEKGFAHDFADVSFDAEEFDRRLGSPGLHRVGRAVRLPERRTAILPPDLLARYAVDNFWRDAGANSNGVRVI